MVNSIINDFTLLSTSIFYKQRNLVALRSFNKARTTNTNTSYRIFPMIVSLEYIKSHLGHFHT